MCIIGRYGYCLFRGNYVMIWSNNDDKILLYIIIVARDGRTDKSLDFQIKQSSFLYRGNKIIILYNVVVRVSCARRHNWTPAWLLWGRFFRIASTAHHTAVISVLCTIVLITCITYLTKYRRAYCIHPYFAPLSDYCVIIFVIGKYFARCDLCVSTKTKTKHLFRRRSSDPDD